MNSLADQSHLAGALGIILAVHTLERHLLGAINRRLFLGAAICGATAFGQLTAQLGQCA